MGFLRRRALYGFNTPADLLRFRALVAARPRPHRARRALHHQAQARRPRARRRARASTGCARVFGPRVFERIWDPLLRAKFGDRRRRPCRRTGCGTRSNREKDGGQEVKGYLRCGYRGLAEALRDAVVARGGEVRLRSPVDAIEEVAGRRPRGDRPRQRALRRRRLDAAAAAARTRRARRARATRCRSPISRYQGVRQRARGLAQAGSSASTGRSSSTGASRSRESSRRRTSSRPSGSAGAISST